MRWSGSSRLIARAEAARRLDRLRLAQDGRDLPHLRPRHRAARRRDHRHGRDRRRPASDEIIRMMVGRELQFASARRSGAPPDEVVLAVGEPDDAQTAGRLLRAAARRSAGHRRPGRVAGAANWARRCSGSIRDPARRQRVRRRAAIDGIGLLPEDRAPQGLMMRHERARERHARGPADGAAARLHPARPRSGALLDPVARQLALQLRLAATRR